MLLKKYAEKFRAALAGVKNARNTGRVAHAYLLYGDTPETRREFSLLIAQFMLCPELDAEGDPCGCCLTCRQLAEEIYPELYVLTPTGKSWQIPVGDRKNPEPNSVRWFEEQFYLTSAAAGGRKVGVILDCDRMNTEAQNALLKTLEEPPSDSIFILATGNPSALLPTTRSRCQTLMLLENSCRFAFEGSGALFDALARLQFDTDGGLAVAEKSAAEMIEIIGSLNTAARKKIEEEWACRIDRIQELEPPIRKRVEKQYEAAIAGEYIRERNYFCGAIYTWFAQTYQLSRGAASATLANPDIFKCVTLPETIDESSAARALEAAEKLLYDLRFNVSETLALRSFCFNVALAPSQH